MYCPTMMAKMLMLRAVFLDILGTVARTVPGQKRNHAFKTRCILDGLGIPPIQRVGYDRSFLAVYHYLHSIRLNGSLREI
jgi:hypothetical protein